MSNKKANNTLETWGNESTMNLNVVIYQNILSSPYFRSLFNKKTFHEIVDEIYNEVYVLSPFVKGTQPSTAFCCLFKLWTLKLTIKQLENLIDHPDSPFIRATGFLYLRYVCAPAGLWDWFQYYLEDEEEFAVSGGVKPVKMTIGKLCRSLITEQKYQGTMLPRIPVPIARDLEKKLAEYDRENRKSSKTEDRHHSSSRDPSGRVESGTRDRSRSGDYDRNRSRDYGRSRSREYNRSRSRDHDRSKSRYRDDRKGTSSRDEFDDYKRRSERHDRDRRSVSPEYRRRDRYRSRSRSRDSYRR